MNGSSPSTIQPKYVALDTATWIDLFKHRTNQEVKDIINTLNSGRIVCYISFEHIWELLQHSVQKSVRNNYSFSIDQPCGLPKTDFFSGSVEKFSPLWVISGSARVRDFDLAERANT